MGQPAWLRAFPQLAFRGSLALAEALLTLLFLYIAAVNVAIIATVLLAWWAHLRFWRWRLELKHEYEHVEVLTLPDGGLNRAASDRRPTDAGPQGESSKLPVLLLHGLAMNHRNHDSCEDASFARHLHKQGRDVWLLTSRSGRTGMTVLGPKHSTFAAMVQHDVPCAVQAVLAHTGASSSISRAFPWAACCSTQASTERSIPRSCGASRSLLRPPRCVRWGC